MLTMHCNADDVRARSCWANADIIWQRGKRCLRMLRVSNETAKLLLIVWQLCADTLSLLYHLPSAFSKAQEESGYVI